MVVQNYTKKSILKIKKKSSNLPPKCKICSSPLKPSVILFREILPSFECYKSQQLAKETDILLVVGSSLTVNPIANLPLYSINAGRKLIIINDESTYLDDKANVVIKNRTEIILPLLLEQIKKEISK
ncbi:MAG: hypothetical protein KGD63_14450 [Candidatus Lokiarchaeota archaeon]|nr:hypothetical protein [Candidatus Lokiarchaeota archaeon]